MGRGIKLPHNKNTKALKPVRMEQVKTVTLLMKQHAGAACVPLVKPGERVLAGQLVGESEARVTAPVHASISGTVKKIETVRLPGGEDAAAVVIESDGRMERVRAVPPRVECLEDFLRAVRDSGLVGLGGAGYPAHAKLRAAVGKAEILLVNGAECEPYATADHREMLDAAPDIIEGIRHICRWLDIHEAIIGIERNKPDAIALLRGLCGEANAPRLRIAVKAVPSRYPQGANKQLSYALTKRVVPLGGRLTDAGLVMSNAASTAFLGRYMRTGIPLITRTVTIDGSAVREPLNVRVPIGISVEEMLRLVGYAPEDGSAAKIILGGPMMGTASPDSNAVISKCTGVVLLFDQKQANLKPETACIRCGKCVLACPMRLQPLKLEQAWQARNTAALDRFKAAACIECGCCSYVCPAGRELVQRIRLGKKLLRSSKENKP